MKTATTSTPTHAPATSQNATRTPPSTQALDGTATPAKRGRKRRPATPAEAPPVTEAVDLTGDTPPSAAKKPKTQSRRQQDESSQPERRARRWRAHPPQSYLTRLDRIMTQRFGHSLGWIALCADTSYAECSLLAIPWAELRRFPRSLSISLGRLAISTKQSSGRCQPVIVPMPQRAISANTFAMVS